MDKNGINAVIAKEGLIILGVSAALYLFVMIFQNMPVALPKYKLQFADGRAYTISISPKLTNNPNYKSTLKDAYNPTARLVDERVKEFIKTVNIKSPLKSYRCVNSIQIYVSSLYSQFFGLLFIFKVVFVYFILLFLRFIIWAVKALKGS